MRLVLQRVSKASVKVDNKTVGAIELGVLVLAGVEKADGSSQVEAAVRKLAGLRMFEDQDGRMNLDTAAAGGSFLVVSQFTLAGTPLARGRRPSFTGAAHPQDAKPLVEALVAGLRREGFCVEEGEFGAHMEVDLVNDGPVTFVLDL